MKTLLGRRLHVDANVFIYAVESVTPWDRVAEAVLDLGVTGQSDVVTSALSLTECLVKPIRFGYAALQSLYLTSLQNRAGLLVAEVTRRVLIEAASIRATHVGCRTPDAIYLATAKQFNCDVFLTNDVRLKNVNVGPQVVLLSDLTI